MTGERAKTDARRRSAALVVGLVASALASLLALRVLSQTGWDASIFTAFGEEASATTEYAEERLGNVFLRPHQGHDGKFFFVQSNDPWVLHPEVNASVLDRPLYRSQRMLYPVLAGGAGLFGPKVVIWAMLIVNLIALGVGSWAVSALAVEMGGSPLWGLSFVFNLGFISEMNIDGAGIVAALFAFWAVVSVLRGRMPLAIALFALGALAREAMLIAAAGSAWWMWRSERRKDALLTFGVPLATVGIWALYLRLRIGLAAVEQVEEIGVPLVGFARAFESWFGDPVDLAVGIAMMVLFVLYTRRVLFSSHLVGWAFLGFVPLGLLFTEQVWKSYFDITRAIAPVITAFVVLVLLGRSFDPGRTASAKIAPRGA